MAGTAGQADTGTEPAAGGTLVVIGARGPDEAAARIAAAGAPAAVVLVEPDPARAAAIEARLAGRAGVRVIQAAVAAADGEADLHVCNLPGVASLAEPTGLAELFPGLRVTARPRVPVLSVPALLARAGALPPPLSVVVDAGGAEAAVLEGLAAAGLLDRVDRLVLRAGVAPLFAGATPIDALEGWLAAQGFAVTGRDATDPDWPELQFVPDTIRRERDALAAALAEARAALAARDTALAEAKTALAEARKAAEAQTGRAAEAEAALAEARAATAARDKALAEARAEAEARAQRLAAAETARTAAQQELAAAQRALATAQGDAEGLRRQRDAALQDRARHEADLGQLRDALRSAEGQVRLLADLLLRDAPL